MKTVLSFRRVFVGTWLAAFPLLLVLWYYPVVTHRLRVETLIVALFILGGALIMVWKYCKVRWLVMGLYVAVAIFLIFPGRQVNRAELRDAYGEAMKSYEGTRYVWGGESCTGIDCSGLIRKGWEDALMHEGILTFNSSLIRESNWLYWNDTTAKVMGEGYLGRTVPVATCSSLNTLDYTLVQPGDLAVTEDGSHIVAYLGNKTWIAADPGVGRVTTFTVPEKHNGYFWMPMQIVRWKILADKN
jgi:hypothetical protein